MAYKRELIVNNGSLTSYKKLLKVSDVCQLLDKREYPATHTVNGVTFTNNGDGAITLNGTATAWAPFLASAKFDVFWGHKYLLYPNPTDVNVSLQLGFRNAAGVWLGQWLCNSPTVYTLTNKNAATGQFWVGVGEGKTVSNVTVTPQAFDLTEMYGAGNEPATVAEFKAKFPNELYDYSPRCWVTSYKTGLIAKTKNLFNYIPPMQKAYDGANITYLESLSNGAIVTGTVGSEPGLSNWSNGWFSPAYSSYSNTPLTPLKSGDVITVSADCTLLKAYSASSMFTRILSSDDIKVSGSIVSIPLELGKTKRISQTFTIISDIDFRPVFTLNSNKVMITNIQIEKGSTATDYVPYGYL